MQFNSYLFIPGPTLYRLTYLPRSCRVLFALADEDVMSGQSLVAAADPATSRKGVRAGVVVAVV